MERRSGGDSRAAEVRRAQGERRGGGDQRGGRAPGKAGSSNAALLALVLAIGCFVDLWVFGGAHSIQMAVDAGGYAGRLAGQWINGGFGR